jgi:hypothetical protein
MNRSSNLRFGLLLIVLLFGGAIINIWENAGEARVSRKSLKEFPARIGSWQQQGEDVRFDDETEKVLRADDYVSRNFNRMVAWPLCMLVTTRRSETARPITAR